MLKIGDWPFKRSGVDCRVCLREPHRPSCPRLLELRDLDAYFLARLQLSTLIVGKAATRSGTLAKGSRRKRKPKKGPSGRF